MRYELWARDHGDTNGLHWILTAASVGPSTFLHLEKAMGKGTHPAFLQGTGAAQSP
jgi:threonine/homoserine/homoserine lactone efflux protein